MTSFRIYSLSYWLKYYLIDWKSRIITVDKALWEALSYDYLKTVDLFDLISTSYPDAILTHNGNITISDLCVSLNRLESLGLVTYKLQEKPPGSNPNAPRRKLYAKKYTNNFPLGLISQYIELRLPRTLDMAA